MKNYILAITALLFIGCTKVPPQSFKSAYTTTLHYSTEYICTTLSTIHTGNVVTVILPLEYNTMFKNRGNITTCIDSLQAYGMYCMHHMYTNDYISMMNTYPGGTYSFKSVHDLCIVGPNSTLNTLKQCWYITYTY